MGQQGYDENFKVAETWPARFEEKGSVRYGEIREAGKSTTDIGDGHGCDVLYCLCPDV